MTLELTLMRLRDSEDRVNKHIDRNILRIAENTILKTAQNNGRSAGLSERAVQAMKIVKTGFMKVSLIWDYRGPNNEPISKYLENGTLPHQIRAKGKIFGGADMLRWFSEAGTPIFRKEVHHPGTQGKHIIANSYKEAKPSFTAAISDEVENYLAVHKL